MTTLIAGKRSRTYGRDMGSALLRLLALAALFLMPFSMGTMASAAVPETAAATEGHCGDHQKPADAPAKMSMHCASCSALPASNYVVEYSDLRPSPPRFIRATRAVSDNVLEIATPPPRNC